MIRKEPMLKDHKKNLSFFLIEIFSSEFFPHADKLLLADSPIERGIVVGIVVGMVVGIVVGIVLGIVRYGTMALLH